MPRHKGPKGSTMTKHLLFAALTIGAAACGGMGQADVQSGPVGLGKNGNSRDAQGAAGADDAHGDLAAIGNQNLSKHRRSVYDGGRYTNRTTCT